MWAPSARRSSSAQLAQGVGTWVQADAVTSAGPGPRRAAVWLTGMSGTGKSTVLDELARRGHGVLDTDDPGWIVQTETPDGPEPLWDLERVRARLDEHRSNWLFVAGCVANQGALYDRFDKVVLLSAPVDVLLARVAQRANPFGSTAEDRTKIASDLAAFEPVLRASADHEIVTTAPISVIVSQVEKLGDGRSDLPRDTSVGAFARRRRQQHVAVPGLTAEHVQQVYAERGLRLGGVPRGQRPGVNSHDIPAVDRGVQPSRHTRPAPPPRPPPRSARAPGTIRSPHSTLPPSPTATEHQHDRAAPGIHGCTTNVIRGAPVTCRFVPTH